jgi:hypothetical protein
MVHTGEYWEPFWHTPENPCPTAHALGVES